VASVTPSCCETQSLQNCADPFPVGNAGACAELGITAKRLSGLLEAQITARDCPELAASLAAMGYANKNGAPYAAFCVKSIV
jgi:hypothetical protein